MALSFTEKKRIRKSFGRIPEAIEMPNLIEVQREVLRALPSDAHADARAHG
jgi:hypothetical protein